MNGSLFLWMSTALLTVALAVGAPVTKAEGEPSVGNSIEALSSKPVLARAVGSAPAESPVPVLAAAPAATQQYSHGDPNAEEQAMLELVNRARANPAAEASRFGIDLNEGITTDPIPATSEPPLAFNVDII